MRASKTEKSIPTDWNKLMRWYKEARWNWHLWQMRFVDIDCNCQSKVVQSHKKNIIWLQARDSTQDSSFMKNSTISLQPTHFACISSKNKGPECVRVDKRRGNVIIYLSSESKKKKYGAHTVGHSLLLKYFVSIAVNSWIPPLIWKYDW